MAGWFDVDRNGLKQLNEHKPKGFVLRELIQNAWDEPGVTFCRVTISSIPSRALAFICVEDDAPEGFHDLTHAFTLFARTRKRADPERRGRFNLGEKQVLALCQEARISTTTGTVVFKADGKRRLEGAKREAGSRIDITVSMTHKEIEEMVAYAKTFIPPDGIVTTVNGERLEPRIPIKTILDVQLGTEYEDDGGAWRRTRRKTSIRVMPLIGGEQKPMLYEMGLPVVELEGGEKFHVDIQQRVPLNSDRDNVPPSFMNEVRAHVLNAMADMLSAEEAAARWTREASGSKLVSKEAFESVMDKRFGENRVAYCPSDSESNRTAASKGYSVLTGGSLSAEEWVNAKRFEAIPSAGTVFATARPKFGGNKDTRVPEDEWPQSLRSAVSMMRSLGLLVLGFELQIEVVRDHSNRFQAWYSKGGYLTLNVTYLRDTSSTEAMLNLMLHEIGHERCGDHKLDVYHDALTEFGAKLAIAAATHPELVLRGRDEDARSRV